MKLFNIFTATLALLSRETGTKDKKGDGSILSTEYTEELSTKYTEEQYVQLSDVLSNAINSPSFNRPAPPPAPAPPSSPKVNSPTRDSMEKCDKYNYKEYIKVKCDLLKGEKLLHDFAIIDFSSETPNKNFLKKIKEEIKNFAQDDEYQLIENLGNKLIIIKNTEKGLAAMAEISRCANRIPQLKESSSEEIEEYYKLETILGRNSQIEQSSIAHFYLSRFLTKENPANKDFDITKSMSTVFMDLFPEGSFSEENKTLITQLFSEMDKGGLKGRIVRRDIGGAEINIRHTNNPSLAEFATKSFSYVSKLMNEAVRNGGFSTGTTVNGEAYMSLRGLDDNELSSFKDILNKFKKSRTPDPITQANENKNVLETCVEHKGGRST